MASVARKQGIREVSVSLVKAFNPVYPKSLHSPIATLLLAAPVVDLPSAVESTNGQPGNGRV
jgi:hypothetical protein